MRNNYFVQGLLTLALAFVFIFTGCDTGTDDDGVSTIKWESDGNGFIQFSTNDPKYNFIYWILYNNIIESNIYEIECKKMSGASNWGYGMIFGASDIHKYYDLGITTQGYYIIGKEVNGKYTKIRDWTKSEKLNTGYNTINTLKVVKNGTTFTVYLNGSQADQFTDTEINGDRLGYWVDVGLEKDESFPNTPVDVRFRQKEEADEFPSGRQRKLPVNSIGAFGTNLTGSLSYTQDAQAAPR